MHGLGESELFARVFAEERFARVGTQPFQTVADRSELLFLGGFQFGHLGIAPFRLVGTVTPIQWAIENVDPELEHLLHFADPARMHPERMICLLYTSDAADE